MATKKTQAMAEFYRQCKQKGYTDMTDDTQSLKAKVIATDLGLRYSDISALYEKAKKCSEEVANEAAEADKERRAKEAQEREKARELAIPGTLLLTFTDTVTDSKESKKVRVYRRPNNSVYYTIFDGGRKIEGTPSLSVRKSEASSFQYHPSQTVFTGATVGGITTGGFHETKAYTTMSSQSSGNGFIELHYKNNSTENSFTVERVIVPEDVQKAFRRDKTFQRFITSEGVIFCSKTDYKDPMAELALRSGNAYAAMTVLSASVDKSRLPRQTCEEICALLQRILRGDYPETDEQVYARAIKLSESASSDNVNKAIDLFTGISDYSDSWSQAQKAKRRYEELLQSEKETAVLQREANKKKSKKIILIVTPIAVACIAFLIVLMTIIIPNQKLNKAKALLDSGDYEAAYVLLAEIGNSEAIASSKYNRAVALLDSGDYEVAYMLLEEIGNSDAIASSKYDRAVALLNSGDYEVAYVLLEEIGNSEAIASSKYDRAETLLYSGDYEAAYMLLNGLNYKDSNILLNEILHTTEWIKECPVGGIVLFGSYEQDNNTSNGKEDIEWLVLAKEGNRILVVSKNALDSQPYNTNNTDVTWESCSLRNWLNGTFLNAAFSADEQAMIPSVTVSADKNPSYSTSPGNSTTDQVFLLSIVEAKEYFDSDNAARRCAATGYAIAQGAFTSDSNRVDGKASCSWWLRSPGARSSSAVNVSTNGSIDTPGRDIYYEDSIRPALWIALGS